MSERSAASIAVLIPCYQEARTIEKVVLDFKAALPGATVYVYDNNSTDDSARIAGAAGAVVRHERLQGKGNVVRRMFADIDADVYLLVDGDDTYDAGSADLLVSTLLDNQLDVVNAARTSRGDGTYRAGHRFGNLFFSQIVKTVFGVGMNDMLSGYRVFSRRFVKSFPALSVGFEVETELTVHALELRVPLAELETPYKKRPEGSTSKLHTVRDGFGILTMILRLIKMERPLALFGSVCLVSVVIAVALAVPILVEYVETGLVPRFPTAILSTGIMLFGFLSLAIGFVLDAVKLSRIETKRLHYLSLPPAQSR